MTAVFIDPATLYFQKMFPLKNVLLRIEKYTANVILLNFCPTSLNLKFNNLNNS